MEFPGTIKVTIIRRSLISAVTDSYGEKNNHHKNNRNNNNNRRNNNYRNNNKNRQEKAKTEDK